jgi:4-amino-4-deoxychorismate lyase
VNWIKSIRSILIKFMSQFLESIRFENGNYHLLELHQERVNRTFAQFFPAVKPLQLSEILPEFNQLEKFKFRVVYDHRSSDLSYAVYEPKLIRSIKLVNVDHLDYSFKYADRSVLNQLVQKAGTDEIIIVKNGLIADSSYANIACFDGHKWWTPEKPLLQGVRRNHLIQTNKLGTKDITAEQLFQFQSVSLINAMMGLSELSIPTFKI